MNDNINNNPAEAKISKDIAHYRDALETNPDAEKEIKNKLKDEHPDPYAKPGFDEFETFTAYKDFGFEQGRKAENSKKRADTLLPRLGGLLNKEAFFVPDPCPPVPEPGTTVPWPSVDGKGQVDIEINDQGAIIHVKNGDEEILEAHQYMEAIFDFILYNVRNKLERINRALVGRNEIPPANPDATYERALDDFRSFRDGLILPDGDSDYRKAFTDEGVGIFPVVTNEGFIVSVRVELHWKNPFHSSSTIRVS